MDEHISAKKICKG